jgi:Lon protease-like protein
MRMGEAISRFPLFPLGLVLLPAEVVPLHIFEERYKLMVGECLERKSEFGVLWMAEGGLREVGCTARVTQLLERMEDGRMNIVTRGTRPFRIVDERHDLPYPAGTVEFLVDKDERPDAKAVAAAHEAYGSLVEQATDRTPEAEELRAMTAYQMAATVDFGREAKQGLLDLRSENARLRLVTRLFRAASRRLEFIERAQERARSNGKVRFS